jgi:hypothetical protein
MQKISVVFKTAGKGTKDYRVLPELREGAEWILTDDCEISVKLDGTACAIIEDRFYKRFEYKKGIGLPPGAIKCSEYDKVDDNMMFWVPVLKTDKWYWEGYENTKAVLGVDKLPEGTYELIGPEINRNPENSEKHILSLHGSIKVDIKFTDSPYNDITKYLFGRNIEGLVFKNKKTGEMLKVRKWDEFRERR